MGNPYLEDTITRLDATGIQVIRARVGMTQVQLAEHLGVSLATVKAWEGGARNPSADIRPKLIRLSRPALHTRVTASQALRDAAQAWDADAIAWRAEGNATEAAQSERMARKLHEMADNHAADPANDPMQVEVQ